MRRRGPTGLIDPRPCRAVEPVTLATARMRTAVSRLAASSGRLSSANSTRLQTGEACLKELP